MAVEGSLVEIYGIDREQAWVKANSWWEGLLRTSAFKSGIFLHAEPSQTAAELIGISRHRMDEGEKLIYKQILRNSMELAQEKDITEYRPNVLFDGTTESVLQSKLRTEWRVKKSQAQSLQQPLKVRA
jgi:hypothetical protein